MARMIRKRFVSASAFFLRSEWPVCAAFTFDLVIARFMRVGNMVAFYCAGRTRRIKPRKLLVSLEVVNEAIRFSAELGLISLLCPPNPLEHCERNLTAALEVIEIESGEKDATLSRFRTELREGDTNEAKGDNRQKRNYNGTATENKIEFFDSPPVAL